MSALGRIIRKMRESRSSSAIAHRRAADLADEGVEHQQGADPEEHDGGGPHAALAAVGDRLVHHRAGGAQGEHAVGKSAPAGDGAEHEGEDQ
jgi:hypothetical protein